MPTHMILATFVLSALGCATVSEDIDHVKVRVDIHLLLCYKIKEQWHSQRVDLAVTVTSDPRGSLGNSLSAYRIRVRL